MLDLVHSNKLPTVTVHITSAHDFMQQKIQLSIVDFYIFRVILQHFKILHWWCTNSAFYLSELMQKTRKNIKLL